MDLTKLPGLYGHLLLSPLFSFVCRSLVNHNLHALLISRYVSILFEMLKLFFKVPLIPYVPAVNILVNIYLMVSLEPGIWAKLLIWLAGKLF